MQNIDTQICIVGAGPAGAITSLLLAKKGIKSILLDKQEFPRHKACADCLTGQVIRILKEIDPVLLQGLALNAEAIKIDGVYAYSSSCDKIKIPFKTLEKDTDEPSCYSIARIDFDNHIMQLAKQNEHITVIEKFQVADINTANNQAIITEKAGNTVTAKIVVLASGSNSKLNQQLGKFKQYKTHTAVGIRGYFTGVEMPYPNYCELFLYKKIMPGGGYLTPLPNGLVNMNVVVRMDKLKRSNLDLKEMLKEFIAMHPVFKDRFKNAKMVGNLEGSTLVLGTKKRRIAGDNFILVGDAAGLIDLLSANGLPQAFISARIAAKHLENSIATQNFSAKALMAYDTEVHKATKNYLKLGKVMSPLLNFEWFIGLIDKTINFLTKNSPENKAIEDLLYTSNVSRSLINPKFYRKLFFGLKNSSSV